MASTDPDFLHYSATGDAAAFQSMVAAHLPMVLATAGRKLGPHSHLAQDVAQSVFTRLARVARGLPDDLVVAPWLHRQTIRLAIDTVRKEERRRSRETTAAMLQSPDSSPAAAPHSPISHLLDEALDQLPASDRSLLVIHYLEGRDSTDMAQTLGSTPAAIRQRISRSLAKLRDLLTRRGVSLSITALAGYLTSQNSSAAPATLVTSISASALRSAALASSTTAILTTALMSHATALTTGALAALLACGLLYQQRETEIARRTATSGEKAAASLSSSALPRQIAPDPDSIPHTLPEIIEAIKTLTDGPDNRVSVERITRLLRRVPPEQYLEFYIAAESRVHPARWQGIISLTVKEWGKMDPGAVVRALVDSDSKKTALIAEAPLQSHVSLNSFFISKNREGGTGTATHYSEVAREWAKADLQSFRRWLSEVSDRPLMKIPVLRSTLREEMRALIAAQLPHDGRMEELQLDALSDRDREIVLTKWAEDKLKRTGGAKQALANPELNASEARQLAYEAARAAPEDCEKIIAEMENPELRMAAALGYVSQWLRNSPDSSTSFDADGRLGRAKFALEQAGPQPSPEVLAEIVTAVVKHHQSDSSKIRDWVLEQGAEMATPALQAGARSLVNNFGADQALQWAAAIPDAAQRSPLLRGIYQRVQDENPAQAQTFLSAATPEIAAELQTPPAAP